MNILPKFHYIYIHNVCMYVCHFKLMRAPGLEYRNVAYLVQFECHEAFSDPLHLV